MANQGIINDPDYMYTQGQRTIQQANDFLGEINVLRSTVDNLASIWLGTAAQTFKSTADAQAAALEEFEGVLNLLGEKICDGAKRLAVSEETNAEEARNMF